MSEKVFELASPYIRPEAFAKLTVAVARWFKNADRNSNPFLIWESAGPGRQFGSRLMELGYGNMYLRKNDERITKKVSDIPGWAPTREGKRVLLGNYRAAVEEGKYQNRSQIALEETLEYVFAPDGRTVMHARSRKKDDPSGANANHGDRVMADALAWKGVGERSIAPRRSNEPDIPVGSLAWRMKQHELAKKQPNEELGDGW